MLYELDEGRKLGPSVQIVEVPLVLDLNVRHLARPPATRGKKLELRLGLHNEMQYNAMLRNATHKIYSEPQEYTVSSDAI